MKSIIIISIALLFALSSCGNKASDNKKKGEHTHADGTVHVHDNCDGHKGENATNQESFKVEVDSLTTQPDSVKSHRQDNCEGHKLDHDHSHNHDHKH